MAGLNGKHTTPYSATIQSPKMAVWRQCRASKGTVSKSTSIEVQNFVATKQTFRRDKRFGFSRQNVQTFATKFSDCREGFSKLS